MTPAKISGDLRKLQNQVGNFEKTIIQLVQARKDMSNGSLPMQEVNRKLQSTPIAIVGMSAIFPKASSLQQYWENILQEVDCITEVPPSRWNASDYYDPDPRVPDKTYCKRGGFIPEIDFNPLEFGLPPNILEATDISQLLSLVVAKQALADAGYGESKQFDREQAGIILGVAIGRQLSNPLSGRLHYPIWERVLKNSGVSEEKTNQVVEKMKLGFVNWQENSFPGLLGNVVAGRIANRLDLGGTNCTVDAACASSLAALKMAISELVEYRCNLMLTGGVDTDNSAFTYICFSKTPALSLKQQSKPFDIDADGILLGEGLGMFVLKRLEDAERDGDRIYAVIKGLGTSSDGRFKSIYAPRAEGQIKALQRAYDDAGIDPATVGLVEAHGTGTMAGDPAEFSALNQFFGEHAASQQSVALGSVKSQIGHTKAAAGAASLMKAALALHHKVLPSTINVSQPNPKLGFESSPFYLNTKTRPWLRSRDSSPRRAGVSSFGFGGTNFHVVLEEHVGAQLEDHRLHRVPAAILLAAQTPEQLLRECEEWLNQLQSPMGNQHYATLVETSKANDIPISAARVGFVALSCGEACDKLQIAINTLRKQSQRSDWNHPKGVFYRQQGLELQGKVVALFSGQGSQYLTMGQALVMNFPELQQIYSDIDLLWLQDGQKSVSSVVFPPPVFDAAQQKLQAQALQRTNYAQPAIAAFSSGLYTLLWQAGFQPDFVAGHSFGELTALWAAGVLNSEDYATLVKARSHAMAMQDTSEQVDRGTMLAVKGALSQVQSVLKDYPQVRIANLNSPQQAVLAGTSSAILALQEHFQQQGINATLLPVSAAFHTPLVAHAQKPFASAIESVTFNEPQIPVYTNITGQRYASDPTAIQKRLKEHLINQVLFQEEIETIYHEGGYCFVEFGPKAVLTNLVKEILGDRPHLAIALNPSSEEDSDRQFREAVTQLQVAGLSLKHFDPYEPPLKVSIPDQKKALNVRLSATNYVSQETQMAFETALQEGLQECLTEQPSEIVLANQTVEEDRTTNVKPTVPDCAEVKITQSFSVPSTSLSTLETQPMSEAESSLPYQRLLDSLEYGLDQLHQHQGETLQVHGQYLNHQMEYAKIFFHLMQQQNTLFANGQGPASETQLAVLESLERGMMRFHEHQAGTLTIHGQSLQQQSNYAQNLVQLLQQQYALIVDQTSIGQDGGRNSGKVDQERSNGNGNRNRYRTENGHPSVVSSSPHQRSGEGSTIVSPVVPKAPVPPPAVSVAPTPQIPATAPVGGAVENLSEVLLTLVSDKTGYPAEMLEMEMEMEADLGIDSIKRVEILSALQEHLPDAPAPDPEALAELRTLGQIIDFTQTQLATLATPPSTETTSIPVATESLVRSSGNGTPQNAYQAQENGKCLAADAIAAPGQPTLPTKSGSQTEEAAPADTKQSEIPTLPHLEVDTAINTAKLGELLLAIVSEKTGYPAEMLEMEMEMEADLGIDSIKRVEILSALQEHLPATSPPEPEDLAELRTLGQIIAYLEQQTSQKKTPLVALESS
jgi:polyketide-type polyunsaturated fatty acid synthase PfaA